MKGSPPAMNSERGCEEGAAELLSREMRTHLEGKILPFWESLRDDKNGGYCGYVGSSLERNWNAHKGCILNSRILWTFSTAARVLEAPSLLEYAHHALDFMEWFRDRQYGGYIWSVSFDGKPLDTAKHTYCQAFAVYALSAYAGAAGDRRALETALDLFDLIEVKCQDPEGYGESYERDFSPQSNEKLSENGILATRTMNTLLHIVEAYAELYRVSSEERVRQRGAAALELLEKKVFDPVKCRLGVFFDRDYRSLLDMQSYGHDIEASWLLWDAAETLLPPEGRNGMRSLSLALSSSVLERAMTPTGLRNENVLGVSNEERVWWVQAEAFLGFENGYLLSGEVKFNTAAHRVWAFIQESIVDHRPGGEWHWSVSESGTPLGKPAVEEWKCPYHNSRMCLRAIGQEKRSP